MCPSPLTSVDIQQSPFFNLMVLLTYVFEDLFLKLFFFCVCFCARTDITIGRSSVEPTHYWINAGLHEIIIIGIRCWSKFDFIASRKNVYFPADYISHLLSSKGTAEWAYLISYPEPHPAREMLATAPRIFILFRF